MYIIEKIKGDNIKREVKRLLIFLIFLLSGCSPHTNAGPFVTNISFDGHRTLLVEKCYTQYNEWKGTVGNSQCTQSKVILPTQMTLKIV